jgi:hypothetical protein
MPNVLVLPGIGRASDCGIRAPGTAAVPESTRGPKVRIGRYERIEEGK